LRRGTRRAVGISVALTAVALVSACGDTSGVARNDGALPEERPRGGSIYASIPGLCDAISSRDPIGTRRALAKLGVDVEWRFVSFDRASSKRQQGASTRSVSEPPAGSVIISVLAPDGSYDEVPEGLKRVLIELAAAPYGHFVDDDTACNS